MNILSGIVTQKPIAIASNNPNFELQAAQREAQKQAQLDDLVAKLSAKHQATRHVAQQEHSKRWTVKY